MTLFKKILLSLFPNDMTKQTTSPAHLFLGLVSAKQFFSVINKKMIENYKLNLFDIALDPFEVKIGFGTKDHIKSKNKEEAYYSYCVVANLNGHRFFNPGNIATSMTMIASLYVMDVFDDDVESNEYAMNCLFTVYLLGYLFASRIKVFPGKDLKSDYNRFIELFFNFYEQVVFAQTKAILNPELFARYKSTLLDQVALFFTLFHLYRRLNQLFDDSGQTSSKDYYQWLFGEEMKKSDYKSAINEYIKKSQSYSISPEFSSCEQTIMNIIFPADILIKYLFGRENMRLTTHMVIAKLYDKSHLDTMMQSFLVDDHVMGEFLLYISDYRLVKDGFFGHVAKMTYYKFDKHNPKVEEEIDEFISSVGHGPMDSLYIPERIQAESSMMERLINFYINHIGSFWCSRGDNFLVRVLKSDIIRDTITHATQGSLSKDSLAYYSLMFYNYSKNVFYYKSLFDGVRFGKSSFVIPLVSNTKEIYNNSYILKLMDETAIATLIQDINQQDIKIYLSHPKLLNQFKHHHGEHISRLSKMTAQKLLDEVYGGVQHLLSQPYLVDILHTHLTVSDISHLKENMYKVDFRIRHTALQKFYEHQIFFSSHYGDMAIIGMISTMRDTLFGFVILLTMLLQYQESTKDNLSIDIFIKIYIIDICMISSELMEPLFAIMYDLSVTYRELMTMWIQLDENEEYLMTCVESRKHFLSDHSGEEITEHISGEDILWMRGYLKNIVYYNRRFIIPKIL